MPPLLRLTTRLVLTLALSLTFRSVALAETTPDPNVKFAAAKTRFDAGDFQEAIELCNELLETHGEAANVWIIRAMAKWNLNDRSGARADISQAIKLDSESLPALRARVFFRIHSDDTKGALADMNRAIDLARKTLARLRGDDAENFSHEHADLYVTRGTLHRDAGNNAAAIEDMHRALEWNPDLHDAWFILGELHENGDLTAAALDDYTRVIELHSTHLAAYLRRGWLHFANLDWEATLADAQFALALEPKSAPAHRLAGYSHFGKGDHEQAAKLLTKAADLDNDESTPYALFIRHFALLRLGTKDKRVATSWGNWSETPWVQAIGKFLAGQIDEEQLDALAEKAPDEESRDGQLCEAHFYIGLARLQAGDRPSARLRFRAAIDTRKTKFIEHVLARVELERLARP